MPYIKQEQRDILDYDIDYLIARLESVAKNDNDLAGVLNYTITRLAVGSAQLKSPKPRYWLINTIVGVLDCVKMELYARVARPYEDEVCEKNGDLEELKEWK